MDQIFDLKPNELAAIVFGIVGMIFGLASYRRAKRSELLALESNERAKRAEERSILNEDRTRELSYAQRKADALGLVTDGEAALLSARRKLVALRDAASEVGATDVIAPAESFLKTYEKDLSGLKVLQGEIESVTASGRSHEDLVKLMESHIAQIRRLTDSKLIAEEMGTFADQAERNIRLVSVHRQVADRLKKEASAGSPEA